MSENKNLSEHIDNIHHIDNYLELKKYIVPKYSPILQSDLHNMNEKSREISEYWALKIYYNIKKTKLWFKHIYNMVKNYVNKNN